MMNPARYLLLLGMILLVGCTSPAKNLPPSAVNPTQTQIPSITAPVAPPPPQANFTPAALATPTLPSAHEPPTFAPALSGGDEGGLYPAQDISLIAQTGHLQFINVYANW